MIVGLTGGIGTGKSTVCGIFKNLGVPVINADEIAHELVETDHSIMQGIVQKFGAHFLNSEHKVDRRKLRQHIFANTQDKLWLEKLLHPRIRQEILSQAKATTYPYCVLEIPLLVEAGMQDIVDRVLTVDCPEDVQIKRAVHRDQFTEAEIRAIIANQITREKRLAVSNDIVENNGDMATLIKHIEQLHHKYLSLAS